MSRRRRLAVALLGAALAVGVSLWIHEDLRGERPDPGPEPARTSAGLPPEGAGTRGADAAAEPGRPLRLVVWSDARNSTEVQDRLVAEVARRRPDATVGLGDLVGMSRTYQFQLLAERLAAAGAPLLVVPGNHDLDPFGTLKPYARVFGAPTWVVVRRGVLLLGIDSSRGHVDPADVAWLEEQAARAPAPDAKRVLFCHYPLFAPRDHPKKGLPEDGATTRLRALAERHAMAVFSGNFHGWSVERHGRVLQVVTGGAGSRPESDAPYHCAAVEVGDEVRVEQVVLAQHAEISELRERFRVLHDEGRYAAGVFPVRAALVGIGAALFLGGLLSLPFGRRSSHSSRASSV